MTSEPLRVWCGSQQHVDLSNRLERLTTSPIALAHLDDRLDGDAARERYGPLLTDYVLTGIEDAEVALVPRMVERGIGADERSFVDTAERAGLRTMVFGRDDMEPVMPSESIILLHPGPTRGAQPRATSLAVPYFFTERTHSGGLRPEGDRPSVAFCGQGGSRPLATAATAARRARDIGLNRIRPRFVAAPLRGHIPLRNAALESLRSNAGVDDRFIVRDRYRAGAETDQDRAQTQVEFDENLLSATYALCVRGSGNFSARFYEALSLGRLPLFVDTDCVLPFEDQIDWRARTVWVDADDVGDIGNRLVSAHAAAIADPQRSTAALRSLWEDRLTVHGFFRHLVPAIRALL